MSKKNNGNYKKGRLVLEEIKFDQVFKRQVKPHSVSSGRIYLPKELLGKTVYVIVEVNDDQNKKGL